MNLKSQISNLKSMWWWLRQVTGDTAYERYLENLTRLKPSGGSCDSESSVLSREEFYLDMLRRRYTGVSRCC